MTKSDFRLGWFLLLPVLIGLGVFTVYPSLESFYLSFYDFNVFMTRQTFAGFENYQMLLSSPDYWQSLKTTGIFVLLTALPSVVFGLAIAVGLDANPFAKGLLRTVFAMPVALSSAMAAMLFMFLYNPSAGYINFVLESLGLNGPNWLGDPSWAPVAIAIATVWKEIGFNVIFFLAGLASVPKDLTEAAEIDGANSWKTFWHVTLPILSPTVLFVSVVSVINAFQSFGQIHLLTGGGPAGATNTLVYNLYLDAFQNFQTGSASAQAVVLFFIMLLFTWIQFRFARSRTHYR